MAGRSRIKIDWPTAAGAFFFLIVGGGFAVFGVNHLVTTAAFLMDGQEVNATVVAQNESCDDKGCTYWPDLKFTDSNGKTQNARTQFGSSAYGYSKDSEIDVLTNTKYEYVRVPGTSNLWLLGSAFFLLGLPCFLFAIWLLARFTFNRDVSDL